MNTQEQTFDLLENTGLNWTVNKRPHPTSAGRYGLYRNDNGQLLGTVDARQAPFQNFELTELLVDACHDLGIRPGGGGELSAGRTVFVQAALPAAVVGDTPIKRFIFLLLAHNRPSMINIGTMHLNERSGARFVQTGMIKVPGRALRAISVPQRTEKVVNAIRAAMVQDNLTINELKRMADITVTEAALTYASKGVFTKLGIDINAKVTPQRQRLITDLHASFSLELQRQGQSMWGLFNGFMHYTNQSRPNEGNHVLESVMTGSGMQMNRAALQVISTWITGRSHEQHPVAS